MDKESLKKIRDFLLRIDEIDIPIQDKAEFIQNASLLFDEDNYDRHIQVLAEHFNEELRWKGKR